MFRGGGEMGRTGRLGAKDEQVKFLKISLNPGVM